jgi:hypothetical protein
VETAAVEIQLITGFANMQICSKTNCGNILILGLNIKMEYLRMSIKKTKYVN